MKALFDETKLSAFVDGELDINAVQEVEVLLSQDERARQYVFDSVKTAARLKAEMNSVLDEDIPKHLIAAVQAPPKKNFRLNWPSHNFMRMAAAILLVFVGISSGMMLGRYTGTSGEIVFNRLPSDFVPVVNAALEHKVSGTPQIWTSRQKSLRVTVTPIKTYRDKSGTYFREYQLEANTDKQNQKINGLAYRISKGEWKTRALFLEIDENSI